MNSKEIIGGYVGTDPVQRLYMGTELVWPLGPGPEPDYFMMPLTFEILTGGTISWTNYVLGKPNSQPAIASQISYSLDSGNTWTQITATSGGTAFQVQAGDIVQFKGTNSQYGVSNQNWCNFSGRQGASFVQNKTTAVFKAYGNIMSLFTLDNGDTYDDWATNFDGNSEDYWKLSSDFAYRGLFNRLENHLVDVEHLIMPSSVMGDEACEGMFAGCTSITKSPVLPAQTLGEKTYWGLFSGCTSLSEITILAIASDGTSFQDIITAVGNVSGNWHSNVPASGVFKYDEYTTGWTGLPSSYGIPSGWTGVDVSICDDAYRKYFNSGTTESECECYMCQNKDSAYCSTYPCGLPYEEQYMTVEALEAGTFHVNNENFDYSLNGGEWTTGFGHQSIQLAAGDKVRFKESTNYDQPGMFSGNTMSFNVYGNLNSMTYGDNFVSQYDKGLRFIGYFQESTGLVDASNLIMPEVTDFPVQNLPQSAYTAMFSGCTSLEYAPELPVAFIPREGYREMFKGCTSLKYIKCLATDISATNCILNWVSGITTDGVFVQASGGDWEQGVTIPDTWMQVDAPEHDEGLWLRYYDAGLENPDYYEVSGSTSGDTYVFDVYEFGGTGLFSDVHLFYDGNYVFLNEVDICGYNTDGADPPNVICGGEGGEDPNTGEYIECNIITGDTRFCNPLYEIDGVVYTPATGLLYIHTSYADCEYDPCEDWENLGYESREDCMCQEVYGGDCPDCAANWEEWGYESYEACMCQTYGTNCPDCDDWENLGYESWEDCRCRNYRTDCPDETDRCEGWEDGGYESYEDCRCQQYGECDDPGEVDCSDWENLGYESEDDCSCQNYGYDTNGDPCE